MNTSLTNIDEAGLFLLLHDPDFDVSTDGYAIIEIVHQLYLHHSDKWHQFVMDLTQQLLLRLMNQSPHVYSMTVGQFPYFEDIEEYWNDKGCYDMEGFQWMRPKTFGPYNMRDRREGK